jgi:hypothetical protein
MIEPPARLRDTPPHQREAGDRRKSRLIPTEGLFPDLGQSRTAGQIPYAQWQADLQASPGTASAAPPVAHSPQPLRLAEHMAGPSRLPPQSPARGTEPAIPAVHTPPRAAGYPIGAVPTDSISWIIISALRTHEGDGSEATRALGKLNIKVGPPPKYNGATDLKTFEQWVLGMVQWFRLHALLGPGVESDRTRVNVIGYSCKDAARDWFHYEVETTTGGPEAWTTLEVVQGLQARFITQ